MPEWGIVQTGFKKKRYIDILADMQARAKANFGDSVVVDTNKPLGKFLDIQAWALSELWEEAEETYMSIAIDSAEGIALDRLVKYKGLRRQTVTTAYGAITISGNPGILINTQFIVGKEDGTTYTVTQEGTIGESGTIDLPITCNYPGSRGNAEIGQVNRIITPITGVSAVTNRRIIVNGHDYEMDSELRERYINTVGGLSTVESIRAATAAVEGVVSNLVIENPTMETDEYGIPPKAFEVYIYGGDDTEIAQSILDSKAAGIQAYGDTIITVYDVNDFPHDIGFTRATVINIQVNVTVTTNQFFPANGFDLIKLEILKYIGGTGPDGTQYPGLKINESVINSYLSSIVWPVGGITDVRVLIAKEGETPADQNIEINRLEIARTDFELIEASR